MHTNNNVSESAFRETTKDATKSLIIDLISTDATLKARCNRDCAAQLTHTRNKDLDAFIYFFVLYL